MWALSGAVVVVMASWSMRPEGLHDQGNPYHSRAFLTAYEGLPDTSNALFTGSGICAGCHGHDVAQLANVSEAGEDVNPTDQWQSSLMANSAKDPFWRAKVVHEVALNPDHQLELEDKCTSCHAPLGHFNAHHLGQEHYAMAQLFQDSLALDGVSCVACHQQASTVGNAFSGELEFDSLTIYGPYGAGKDDAPLLQAPMQLYTPYENIMYGAHLDGSEACAGCHSLVTQTADMEGNLTGQDYIEQATYHEWLNSSYADDGDTPTDCQDCHMPEVSGGVVIASGQASLGPRAPFKKHILVGGNAQMLEIMRDNTEALGLSASVAQFDSTIAWTRDVLRNETVELTVQDASWVDGLGSVAVEVVNKAGHKFPSGYPARRAWIEVVAHQGEDTLWHNGRWSPGGFLHGVDEGGLAEYEPHYTTIDAEDQVQVYELVAVDVTGTPTNVLERAASSAKDNRLLPLGFSDDHEVYDTTRVEGLALYDLEFAFESELGLDRLTYDMTASPSTDLPVVMDVRVWYQSMPPRWVAPMFDIQDSTIQAFQALFEAQGAAPELVAETSVSVPVVSSVSEQARHGQAFPNPTVDGRVTVVPPLAFQGGMWELYDPKGSRVNHGQGGVLMELQLPAVPGTYVLQMHSKGQHWVRRLVRK
jgi:hypothetical protein